MYVLCTYVNFIVTHACLHVLSSKIYQIISAYLNMPPCALMRSLANRKEEDKNSLLLSHLSFMSVAMPKSSSLSCVCKLK